MKHRRNQQHPRTSTVVKSAETDAFAAAAAKLDAQAPIRTARLQQIASQLRSQGLDLVEKQLREYLADYPEDAAALGLLAQVAARLGRHREAASLLIRCIEQAPGFSAARFNYAKLLFKLNEFDAALKEIDRLLDEDCRSPLFRQLKADVLGSIGEDEQALAILEQLALENPGHAECWVSYGRALRTLGFLEESIAAYRKALEARPSCGSAYWALANLKTFRFSDGDIAAMQEQAKRSDIAADDRTNLLFALGKAYEDLGAYDRSFEKYAKANAILRSRIDYDLDKMTARVANTKALFTPEFLRRRSDAGCKIPDPIFVLGRLRSGSTLIEQILSSHSIVEGTRELPYIPALARRLQECECLAQGADYPEILGRLEASALKALGEEYLEKARAHRTLARPFFIDKNPANYLHVGMILLILPNAKIIDARRNPAACCLSMFKQNFSETNFRLNELGRVYREYVALMAHFDRVLPGKMHRVIYENLVMDPEGEIRRLLDYLGLPFDESCLRFYETRRAVRTPSSEQVRQPIYSGALDHWRNYEPWLGPLSRSLGSVLSAYPAVPEDLL